MNYNEIINIFLIIGFIFVIGCSKLNLFSGTDYSAFSQLPSWDQNEGAIPNDSFFYVRLARENYEGHNFLQHAMYELDGGPGTDCKIPIDQKSSEDIFCQLEKLEGDLWAHPTVIEYNVPPGMCDYVAFDIPWHFNQNAGAGSKEVYKCDQNIGAAPDENGNIETEERYCLELGEEEILRGKKKVKEAVYTDCGMCSEKIEDICKYNRSNENENLSDCCIGTYTVTGRNEDVGEEGSFGDDLTKCIGGLGRMNWDYKNDLGIPQTIIYSADSDGYIGTYEIPSLDESIEKGETATFVVANYYDGIEEFNLDKLPTIYKTTALDSNHTAYRDLEGGEDGYPYFYMVLFRFRTRS